MNMSIACEAAVTTLSAASSSADAVKLGIAAGVMVVELL
jgi:hypothetical protein